MPGPGGNTDPYLPGDLDTTQHMNPETSRADHPGQGPPTPHQQGTPNPKWGEAKHNLLNFAGLMFSSTFSK